jgi:hypothetical protein
MPKLKHSIPGQPFDWNKSEVVQWLADNPKAINLVFETAAHSWRTTNVQRTNRLRQIMNPFFVKNFGIALFLISKKSVFWRCYCLV